MFDSESYHNTGSNAVPVLSMPPHAAAAAAAAAVVAGETPALRAVTTAEQLALSAIASPDNDPTRAPLSYNG